MEKQSLQQRLQAALDFYRCRPSHLAKASGASQAVVHRIYKGDHENVMASTLNRLEPFLSLAMPVDCMDGIGRRPKVEELPGKANEFQMP